MKKNKKNDQKIMYVLLGLAGIILIYQLFAFSSVSVSSGVKKVQLPADASINDIIVAFLPGDADDIRPYKWKGNQVSLSGYAATNGKVVVSMEREISVDSLTAEQKEIYQQIISNVYHPCCDAPIGGCGCLHAVAGRGLAKHLLQEGWTEEQIYDEILLWEKFWWPKHYAGTAMYLAQEGQDPFSFDSKTLLGSQFSTVRAGRAMGAALGVKFY